MDGAEARGGKLESYHTTRLAHDPRREALWSSLWRFHFSRLIGPEDSVLEFGAGYGHFINNVVARRRIAIDLWPEFTKHLAPDVEGLVGGIERLEDIEDDTLDFVFASNVFEHISKTEFSKILAVLRTKIRAGGTLSVLQPNFRYAYREYFDDYAHVSVYTHISLADFIRAQGYEVVDVRPRFLPLTIKSRFPVSPYLIWLYLRSPIKLFGKQMFICARPSKHDGSVDHTREAVQ